MLPLPFTQQQLNEDIMQKKAIADELNQVIRRYNDIMNQNYETKYMDSQIINGDTIRFEFGSDDFWFTIPLEIICGGGTYEIYDNGGSPDFEEVEAAACEVFEEMTNMAKLSAIRHVLKSRKLKGFEKIKAMNYKFNKETRKQEEKEIEFKKMLPCTI